MNIPALILVPLLMVGCTCAQPRSTAVSAAALRKPDSFRFIGATTTVQEVIAGLGKPDLEVGYGQQGYFYRLSDGSFVIVGFVDPSQILYVRHGHEILYERK